jgi:hypothetical protein
VGVRMHFSFLIEVRPVMHLPFLPSTFIVPVSLLHSELLCTILTNSVEQTHS